MAQAASIETVATRRYTIRPKVKQRLAVERMVENGGNVSKSMVEAGYTPATAKNPEKLTKSKGFQELMASFGLTQGLVATSLVDDIKAKPQKRVEELKLAATMLGMAQKGAGVGVAVQVNVGKLRDEFKQG